MYKLSKRSKDNRDECTHPLRLIIDEAIKYFDFLVYEGHRSLEDQMKYFKAGKSKIDGVRRKGKHNFKPSKAFNCVPAEVFWSSRKKFLQMAIAMFKATNKLIAEGKIDKGLRWGGDFYGDGDKRFTRYIKKQLFLIKGMYKDGWDMPHFEEVPLKWYKKTVWYKLGY